MRAPTYYSRRLSDLETEYELHRENEDYPAAAETATVVRSMKKELQKVLNEGADPDDEATSTRRFQDVENRYFDYCNWTLLLVMLPSSETYFRSSSI